MLHIDQSFEFWKKYVILLIYDEPCEIESFKLASWRDPSLEIDFIYTYYERVWSQPAGLWSQGFGRSVEMSESEGARKCTDENIILRWFLTFLLWLCWLQAQYHIMNCFVF